MKCNFDKNIFGLAKTPPPHPEGDLFGDWKCKFLSDFFFITDCEMKGNISGFGPEYMQHFNIFRYRSPICAVFPRTGPQSTGPIPCSKGSVKENFVILHFTIALTRFQYFDVSGNYKHISFFLGKHFFIIGLGLVFCSGPSPKYLLSLGPLIFLLC